METSITQDDYASNDIDFWGKLFQFIEDSDNGDETEKNTNDNFSESSNVKEWQKKRVKSGKTNKVNRPVWLKEKQSGNKLKQRSSVNIVKETCEPVKKAKCAKNEKSYFEFDGYFLLPSKKGKMYFSL